MRIVKMLGALLVAASATVLATDILSEGVDNARTGWVKDEKVFTTANVGAMKLLWKLKLESTPRAMHNLFAPLIAEKVTTPQGTREIGIVAGVSDDLFGIDVATGQQIWHIHFDGATEPGADLERHALPRRPDRRADDGAGLAGQIHRVCGLVGWTPAAGQRRRRPGRRARRRSSCPAAASLTR